MTISTTARKAGPFIGNGSQTVFPFTYVVFSAADVLVVRGGAGVVEAALTHGTDYSVTLNPDQRSNPGGSVVLASPLPVGAMLALGSQVDSRQDTALTNAGGFFPRVIERALDKLTILIQQLFEKAGRALTLPFGAPADISTTLPLPESNKLIGWDSAAKALQNMDPSVLATLVAFGTAVADPFDGDGTTTEFALSANAGALGNLGVSVAGITQTPGADFDLIGGTRLRFSEAPPAGFKILARYFRGMPQGITDSGASMYSELGVYAEGTVGWALKRLGALVAAGGGGAAGGAITSSQILDLLSGRLTVSQLGQSLAAQIALISAPASVPGSPAALVQQETLARNAAVMAEAAARGTVISQTTNELKAADTALAQQIASVGAAANGAVAAVTNETTARVTAVSAVAQRVSALEAGSATTGGGYNDAELRARVTASESAITGEGSARAAAISALDTAYKNADATLQGSINSLSASTSNALANVSTRVDTVQSTVGNQGDRLATVEATAASTASRAGVVESNYTLKVQARSDGKLAVAGIGLAASAGGAAPAQSELILMADRVMTVSSFDGALVPMFTQGVVNGSPTTVFNAAKFGDQTFPARLLVDGEIETKHLKVGSVSALLSFTYSSGAMSPVGTNPVGQYVELIFPAIPAQDGEFPMLVDVQGQIQITVPAGSGVARIFAIVSFQGMGASFASRGVFFTQIEPNIFYANINFRGVATSKMVAQDYVVLVETASKNASLQNVALPPQSVVAVDADVIASINKV